MDEIKDKKHKKKNTDININSRENSTVIKEEHKDNQEHSAVEPKTEEEPKKNVSDKVMIYTILVIALVAIAIIFIPKLMVNYSVMGLDELHQKNLEGKLPKEKGYMYDDAYSFVFYDNLWYGQVATPSGTNVYDIPFHFGPRDVDSIKIEGELNYTKLDEYQSFYVAFDPSDPDLNYIALSIGEADAVLINVFSKGVVAACTKNETNACSSRPIVNCSSTKAPIFIFDADEETAVKYDDNCILISGKKEGIVKATDRMLFDMLHMISR